MMFGRESRAPVDLLYGVPDEEAAYYESYDGYVDQKLRVYREAYRLAREHLGCRADRAKRGYDLRVRPARYKLGRWVFYYSPRRYVGRSPKWQRLYGGPFLITKVLGPVNVLLQSSRRAHGFVAHIDKLKPCYGETPRSWIGVVEEQEEGVREDILEGACLLQEGTEGNPEPPKTDTSTARPERRPHTDPGASVTARADGRPSREVRPPAYLRDFLH